MGPTIYKPSIYKTPGVYKGAGGIYNGRGVYNDGASGGGVIRPLAIDGYEYRDVKIGNLYWLAENLRCNVEGMTRAPEFFSSSKAYSNLQFSNNGRYYIGGNANMDKIMDKITPTGWRLPTKADFENLFNSTGSGSRFDQFKRLQTTRSNLWGGYVGTDDFGFTWEGYGEWYFSQGYNDFFVNQGIMSVLFGYDCSVYVQPNREVVLIENGYVNGSENGASIRLCADAT